MQTGTATMENIVEITLKTGNSLYDPAIPLLGIYPEKTKIEKDTMFIAAYLQ